LSGRNPLLNYRHPKGSSLRIVDEVPSAIFDRLATSATPLLFENLPAPIVTVGEDVPSESEGDREPGATEPQREQFTEDGLREWAIGLGIDPSYDLPATAESDVARHRDSKLQTLLFPEMLERRLQTIDRRAKSALAETGVNLLHLLFGFVE